MQPWEYKVVSVDYRGRISVEGQETLIGGERRTTFLRRFLDTLGAQGWELVSIQPLTPPDAYYILKRQRPTGAHPAEQPAEQPAAQPAAYSAEQPAPPADPRGADARSTGEAPSTI